MYTAVIVIIIYNNVQSAVKIYKSNNTDLYRFKPAEAAHIVDITV